jgi:phage replication-related protein YjqB (UPF0714/DUF867 family)
VGRSTQILAGGGNRELAGLLAECLTVPGHQVVTDLGSIPRELRGLHPDNPVNRARGGGAQLELSSRIRGTSPRSQLPGDDGLTPATAALVAGLAAAAGSWRAGSLDGDSHDASTYPGRFVANGLHATGRCPGRSA